MGLFLERGTFVCIRRDNQARRFRYGPALALCSQCHRPSRNKATCATKQGLKENFSARNILK